MFNLLMDFIIKAFRYMASLLTHFKSAQGRTTVIGYHLVLKQVKQFQLLLTWAVKS